MLRDCAKEALFSVEPLDARFTEYMKKHSYRHQEDRFYRQYGNNIFVFQQQKDNYVVLITLLNFNIFEFEQYKKRHY